MLKINKSLNKFTQKELQILLGQAVGFVGAGRDKMLIHSFEKDVYIIIPMKNKQIAKKTGEIIKTSASKIYSTFYPLTPKQIKTLSHKSSKC